MTQTGFSNKRVAEQMVVHHSVIYRLIQRLQAAGMVDERPRSGMPRKTTPREDRLIARCDSSYSKSIEFCVSSICKATHKATTTVITSSADSLPAPFQYP